MGWQEAVVTGRWHRTGAQHSRTIRLPASLLSSVTESAELRGGVPYAESGRAGTEANIISPETLVTEDLAQLHALLVRAPHERTPYAARVATLVDAVCGLLHAWGASVPEGQCVAQMTLSAHSFERLSRAQPTLFAMAAHAPAGSAAARPEGVAGLAAMEGPATGPGRATSIAKSACTSAAVPAATPATTSSIITTSTSATDIEPMPSSSGGLRTLLHLDCDCFYAQVEARRLGIDASAPLAVVQWGGLLAVNYPARAFGVKRGMRVEDALAKCPGLHTPHVPLISDEGPSNVWRPSAPAMGPSAGPPTGGAAVGGGAAPAQAERQDAKVSLERYRVESQKIFGLLAQLAPEMEKVSIDEAYLDVTDLAATELRARRAAGSRVAAVGWDEATHCIARSDKGAGTGGGSASGSDRALNEGAGTAWRPDPDDPLDVHLLAAAAVCARLRRAVREQLGYDMSAGIAHSKMIAKLASAKHKPARQTIVPRRAVADLMSRLPVQEVRGLGGSLGAQVVEKLGITFAGELCTRPYAELASHFGEQTARWLMGVGAGGLDEHVAPTLAPKSLNAFKSFAPTSDDATIRRWIRILSAELVERMAADRAEWSRVPKKLKVQFRGKLQADHRDKWVAGRTNELTPTHSRQCGIPGGGHRPPTIDQLARAAIALLAKGGGATPTVSGDGGEGEARGWPVLTRLALAVGEFGEMVSSGSVARFLVSDADRKSEAARATTPRLAATAPGGMSDTEVAVDGCADYADVEAGVSEHALDAMARYEGAMTAHAHAPAVDTDAAAAPGDAEETTATRAMASQVAAEARAPLKWHATEGLASATAAAHMTVHEGWQCSRCTFLNSSLLPACEMCELPAPTAPSSRPASGGGHDAQRKRLDTSGPKRGSPSKVAKTSTTAPATGLGLQAYGFVRRAPNT